MGRELLEYLSLVPLAEGVRIGVAILCDHGGVRFGVTTDYDTMLEGGWFCQRIEAWVAERAESTASGARQ